jgi:hypothetical protein
MIAGALKIDAGSLCHPPDQEERPLSILPDHRLLRGAHSSRDPHRFPPGAASIRRTGQADAGGLPAAYEEALALLPCHIQPAPLADPEMRLQGIMRGGSRKIDRRRPGFSIVLGEAIKDIRTLLT